MVKNWKVVAAVSVAVILSVGAENKEPETKVISGTVAQVGFVESFLVVSTTEGNLTFTVTDKTSMLIGSEKVSLSDIKAEDSVRIQYYSPEPGKYVAVSITETRGTSD